MKNNKNNTKKVLAYTLKNIMKNNHISKITITEIIKECKINRKTFYYHFENIYDLIKWIFKKEIFEVIEQYYLVNDWEEVVIFIVDYINENRYIFTGALEIMGPEEMKKFFHDGFISIINSVVNSLEDSLNLEIPDDFKNFFCEIYSETLLSLLVNLFKGTLVKDKSKIINYISLIFKSSIPEILKSASKSK